jgi:hypothetical protein
MKLSRLLIAAMVIGLVAASLFAQEALDAKSVFLKWKTQNITSADSENYQGAGFTVAKAEGGVVANFYLEYGKNISGPRAVEFIAQPVIVTWTEDGKSTVIDVGNRAMIRSENMMLGSGADEDRIAGPQLTFPMPKKANAVRLTVKNMFGEEGSGEIILGVGAHGTMGRMN